MRRNGGREGRGGAVSKRGSENGKIGACWLLSRTLKNALYDAFPLLMS